MLGIGCLPRAYVVNIGERIDGLEGETNRNLCGFRGFICGLFSYVFKRKGEQIAWGLEETVASIVSL